MSFLDDDALSSLYRDRASALARPAIATAKGTAQHRIVLFQLSDTTYGAPVNAVERIFARPTLTRTPGVGMRWAGVFAVQGEITPVLHLARILGLPEAQQDFEYILTLRAPARRLGLLVGNVLDIRHLPAKDLRPAVGQARYLKGVSADNTLVLDLDRLMEQELSR